MEEIFLRESTIFSRQWKQEDIIKLMKFKKDNKNDIFADDYEEDDKKINIEDYNDLLNEFYRLFIQKEIDLLDNDIKNTIEYFYLRELMLKNYISEKYKFNDNKRHLYLRLLDYLLRVQFEGNEAIREASNLINKLISEINESYLKESSLDLSDIEYMNKMKIVLGTKENPHFLLREGFRIRRGIQNNKDIFIESLKNENKKFIVDDNSTLYSENELSNSMNEPEEKKIINKEEPSVKDIIKNIEEKKTSPFGRHYNEIYIILFFLAIKENKNETIYDSIKKNFDQFIEYFKIDSYKEFDKFKKKYIDINIEEISNEIIYLEFSELNKSEYLCKYILASYYVLIKQILDDVLIYKYLLLFL